MARLELVPAAAPIDSQRREIAIEAAQKMGDLFEALLYLHPRMADSLNGELIAAAALVRSVAVRGSNLATSLASVLDGESEESIEELTAEVRNG